MISLWIGEFVLSYIFNVCYNRWRDTPAKSIAEECHRFDAKAIWWRDTPARSIAEECHRFDAKAIWWRDTPAKSFAEECHCFDAKAIWWRNTPGISNLLTDGRHDRL